MPNMVNEGKLKASCVATARRVVIQARETELRQTPCRVVTLGNTYLYFPFQIVRFAHVPVDTGADCFYLPVTKQDTKTIK